MRERELHCETCRGVRLFEVPPCVDDHGVDCPELLCTDCGHALLIALPLPLPGTAERPAERDVVASTQRSG